MMVGLLLVLLPLVAKCHSTAGVLDLHELHSVQYSIQMFDTPVSEEEQLEGLSTMMVNKEGQKYRCSLPTLEQEESKTESEEKQELVTDVASLLAPLADSPCIIKTKEWWTYEICYNRDIKQYHVENDKPVGAIMILGVHSAGLDNWEPSNKTYLPQWYTNGSRCDLTGRARQTELRFVCNEAATVEFIGDIFEPQSCEYTIVVHTAKLCNVPWLKPVSEPTPHPIHCNPILTGEQFNRYQLYQEKKKELAALEAEQKKKEVAAALQEKSKLGEMGAMDSILNFAGDNMADTLFKELNTMLDSALTGNMQSGIKVIDLRPKEGKVDNINSPSQESATKVDETETDLVEKLGVLTNTKSGENANGDLFTPDGKWNLLNTVQKPILDEQYKNLVASRNDMWRKIHDAKKEVKKYASQLHDTKTFLENESIDVFKNKKVVEKLKQQQKTLEKAVAAAKEKVRLFEGASKDVSRMIVAKQGNLRLLEEQLWTGRIEVLVEMMKQGATDFTEQLQDMADDYRKITNERLLKIDDYFKVAKAIVNFDDIEDSDKLEIFMKFADGELMSVAEKDGEAIMKFNREVDKLSEARLSRAAKFRDVIKDDVREKFGEILKEVSDELELPDGDVDKDDAMKAMSETLDQLIGKLSVNGDRLNKVQKQVADLKKLTADQDETDRIASLRRDNKKTVKKDLWVDENGFARGSIPGIHKSDDYQPDDSSVALTSESHDKEELLSGDSTTDNEPNSLDKEELQETKDIEKLDSEIKELDNEIKELDTEESELEKIIKDLKGQSGKQLIPNKLPAADLDKVKVSVTKVTAIGDSTASDIDEEQTAKIVKRLEGTLKDKLGKLGLETGGRPIEVKLITTRLPDVVGDDQQAQDMMYNMMTGNVQGYQDIDSQRKSESSYKFTWEEEDVGEIEQKIESLATKDSDGLDEKISEESGDNSEGSEIFSNFLFPKSSVSEDSEGSDEFIADSQSVSEIEATEEDTTAPLVSGEVVDNDYQSKDDNEMSLKEDHLKDEL